MADFTDQDKETLDKLRKGFEQAGKTTSTRDPWQERMVHDTSTPSRSILASNIIEGFAGSWAAQYKYGLGSTIAPTAAILPEEPVAPPDPDGPPIPIRAKTSKIGQRGVPEINFVPFNWYTNTFGTKGPSLTGHPISYEVVGATLKSPFCDWTWEVLQGAGPSGGDLLRMSTRPDGGSGISTTLVEGYNISNFTLGTATEPNGGLYVIISDDGANPGSLPVGRTPMGALAEFVDTAKYEVFRILSIVDDEIELHPNKPLSDFFDLPTASVDRSIRALTVIAPFVTRLQAFPDSGVGPERQQTFAILTPEVSASSDLYPPYNNALGNPGTWLTGGFTLLTAPNDPGAAGSPDLGIYGGKMRLPIPQPIREGAGSVLKSVGLLPPADIGLWTVDVISSGTYPSAQILRISATSRDNDLFSLTFGDTEACMGWFPIHEIVEDGFVLARNAEVDPQTGLVYYGPGPYISSTAVTQDFQIGFTVHEPVSNIWSFAAAPTPFNVDQVEAATLKNLIDPNWVGRFEKQISDPLLVGGQSAPPAGSGAGRPDRAIFNTAIDLAGAGPLLEVENPGSLMDLGFRIVLYPAKENPNAPTEAIPDFDRPIYTRETVIDGSIQEKQWIDIDYSAGLVRLSHPPPTQRSGIPDEPSDIIPNGIQGTTNNNPRAEVMLFAACVPYSMEESQVGTGARVTTEEGVTQTDVYSEIVEAQIMDAAQAGGYGTNWTGTPPYIGISTFPAPTGVVEIMLTDLWKGPPTGILSISSGTDVSPSFGRWGYTEIGTRTLPGGKVISTLGGISSVPSAIDPTPLAGQHRLVILRRDVFFGTESLSLPSITDFYPSDTYYGNSQRVDTLRFKNATLEPQLDGSVIRNPRPDLSLFDKPWGSAMPSKLEYPLGDISTSTAVNNFLGEDGILTALDYQINPIVDPASPGPKGPIWDTFFTGLPGQYFYAPDADPGIDNWHGVITQGGAAGVGLGNRGILLTNDNFRMTAKFSYFRRDADTTGSAFIGCVQDEGVGAFVDPTVGSPTNGYTLGTAMAPRFSAIGLLLDQAGPGGDEFTFWARGSGGDFLFPTGISVPGVLAIGPYYFVMEYKRVPNLRVAPLSISFVGTTECRMALYDQDLRCIASTVVAQSDRQPAPSAPGNGLFWGFGMRSYVPVSSTPYFYFHGSTLVVDSSLPRIGPVPPFPTF